MTITETIAVLAIVFSVGFMLHMKSQMDEAIMEMKRASCRMKQLEEEIEETKEERITLTLTDE